jgi:hypothetical protein
VRWLKGKFYTLQRIVRIALTRLHQWQRKCNRHRRILVSIVRGVINMLSMVIESLFGCSHRRTTFPITPKRPVRQGAHVTCLDCGKEFAYNWTEMRREAEPVYSLPANAPLPIPAARPAEGLSRLLRLGS